MDIALDIIGWAALLAGSVFSIIGGLGIVRFPDFYTRLHASGITDTLGAGLILVGLMFIVFSLQMASLLVIFKLLTILLFLLVTSPTACHALAQSALTTGLRPMLGKTGEMQEGGEA